MKNNVFKKTFLEIFPSLSLDLQFLLVPMILMWTKIAETEMN